MPSFTPKFFSIVLLGRQNPQILNHNFLIENNVIPVQSEPFKSLIEESSDKKQPFTEYISTPVVTTLRYKWISIIIEENRFQIKDDKFENPSKSLIIGITKNYFGNLLRYTPFRLGGINFFGELNFINEKDESDFDHVLGVDSHKSQLFLKTAKARYSTKIDSSWNGDKIEIRINKPKEGLEKGEINFNYEYNYEDIDSFINKLYKTNNVYKKFNEILKLLKVKKKL